MGFARSIAVDRSVEVDVDDADTLVVVHGPLDRTAAVRFERAVRLIDRSGQVVVDLSDVPRVTRRGARALAALGDDARAAGGRLSLRYVRPPVLRTVEEAGVDADATADDPSGAPGPALDGAVAIPAVAVPAAEVATAEVPAPVSVR